MDRNMIEQLQNADVYSESGDKIGSVGQVYLDDQTSEPTFVTVKTGLFGGNETFIPLNNARHTNDGITVPFEKDFVKDAPNVDADGNLTPEEEQRIYEYYSMDYQHGEHRDGDVRHDEHRDGRVDDREATAGAAGTGLAAGEQGRHDVEDGHTDLHHGTEARHADDRHADSRGDVAEGESMVVRDEKLNVGTERRESGRVRLRKHSYTATETVEVPVQREEIVVEREPVDANSAQASGVGSDDEVIEMTTHEDVPVVDKTVEAEKVSLGKRTHEDTERISEEVRHEDVQVEGNVDGEFGEHGHDGRPA
ncbi:MAG: PRC and DUF2382 domain-containing protein [Micrococcus sp.]|nr:PRC and DUF2382 domain-containing protein [Micrococcus sp.]